MKINDHVWIFESTLKMPLIKLPVASTLLKTSRGLVLISPGSNTARLENEMTQIGRVTDVVAPSLLHHLSVHVAQETFPQATVWCARDLDKKRRDIRWDKYLSIGQWTFDDEIKIVEIQGTKYNEVVFFHMKTKTLVVTDLFFNLLNAKGLGAQIILRIFGTYRRFAVSSFYLRGVIDLAAFKRSLEEISKFDFETIIMSHGDPVTKSARELFDRALKERNLI